MSANLFHAIGVLIVGTIGVLTLGCVRDIIRMRRK